MEIPGRLLSDIPVRKSKGLKQPVLDKEELGMIGPTATINYSYPLTILIPVGLIKLGDITP
ncbi:hypothetical protein WG947_01630 [Pontibacter sp. H259]|uniref:hypothetical protein n=1 Tax=Pontibacter sp. H259 TaxID=3133421 RepID=UPI0030C11970